MTIEEADIKLTMDGPSPLTSLVGRIYGDLLVLAFAGRIDGNSNNYWRVRCIHTNGEECGNEFVAHQCNLKRGQSKSCGQHTFDVPYALVMKGSSTEAFVDYQLLATGVWVTFCPPDSRLAYDRIVSKEEVMLSAEIRTATGFKRNKRLSASRSWTKPDKPPCDVGLLALPTANRIDVITINEDRTKDIAMLRRDLNALGIGVSTDQGDLFLVDSAV